MMWVKLRLDPLRIAEMSDNTGNRETCYSARHQMIIVVEGISAAGKTTWCHKHAAEVTIPETGPCGGAPDPVLDPHGAARFWVEQGARRWTAACEMERSRGITVCDTDPLKLHYAWSLWQIASGISVVRSRKLSALMTYHHPGTSISSRPRPAATSGPRGVPPIKIRVRRNISRLPEYQ
jgi:hypothetical protein